MRNQVDILKVNKYITQNWCGWDVDPPHTCNSYSGNAIYV